MDIGALEVGVNGRWVGQVAKTRGKTRGEIETKGCVSMDRRGGMNRELGERRWEEVVKKGKLGTRGWEISGGAGARNRVIG